ncbi:hypothetical protein [Argonema antarcticum]|uniref:hypothetical protein n=1 Tax=Argonema antarcticum TaxID=2942763 RepID=UPI002012A884|nr:hypothetical protein [Argonema antarcticum]MCL1471838.1 hypothetical protein [Argonema antarcticum A004/B2]
MKTDNFSHHAYATDATGHDITPFPPKDYVGAFALARVRASAPKSERERPATIHSLLPGRE